jgi:uncharacterized membrane protein (DUF485 family)
MSATLPLSTAAVEAVPSAQGRDDDARYWDAAIASASFTELLQTKTRLVKPLLLASFAFIITTMLLAGYAKGFMAQKVIGAFNMGYLLVFATYLLCWGVAIIYVRSANAKFDTQSAAAIVALQARRPA